MLRQSAQYNKVHSGRPLLSPEKNLGPEKIWVPKKFGSQKFELQKIWVQKNLGPKIYKIYLVPKILGPEKFGPQEMF